jgi:riboflavin kinase/FMN adenylyltransferase
LANIPKNFSELDSYDIKNSIVTIGSFDGIHLGHKKILDKVNSVSKDKNNSTKVVITFDPNPNLILGKNKLNKNYLISSLNKKIDILTNQYQIDIVVVLRFDKKFALITARNFLKKIVSCFQPTDFIIGYNHSFGFKKEGDFDFLRKNSIKYNYKTHKVKAKKINLNNTKAIKNVTISSTLIREYLLKSKIMKVNMLLGRYFALFGTIIKGKGIGKKINFPTINVIPFEKKIIMPNRGVYLVKVSIDKKLYKGMCNIGFRPTVTNSKEESIEVHIFSVGISSNFYNKDVSIFFIKYIREEKKFKNLEFLAKQLKKDKQNCLSTNF